MFLGYCNETQSHSADVREDIFYCRTHVSYDATVSKHKKLGINVTDINVLGKLPH